MHQQLFLATLCGGPRHGEQIFVTGDPSSLVVAAPVDLATGDFRSCARHTYARVRRIDVGDTAHLLLAHESIDPQKFHWAFSAAVGPEGYDEKRWWQHIDETRLAGMAEFPVLPDTWEWVWVERRHEFPEFHDGSRHWRCRPAPKKDISDATEWRRAS